jgi:hypothetical protein
MASALGRFALLLLAVLLGGHHYCFAPALAFAPKSVYGIGTFGETHQGLTEDAFESLAEEFFGLSKLTKAMRSAREQWVDANERVDLNQFLSSWHFDGENFAEGQARLLTLRQGCINGLKNQDALTARENLGGALHTIQDFYSHSNWVELGNGDPNPALGEPGQKIANTADPFEVTCSPDGGTLNTTKLTSGYYGGEDRTPLIPQKCRHGGVKDSSSGSSDINKDGRNPLFSPGSGHAEAARLALEATQQFIRSVKNDITTRELKLLFGVGPTLGFAIDTTGSMGPVINGVKGWVSSFVQSRVGTDQEPALYVMSPFNDPGVGPLTTTQDASSFVSATNQLFAAGGGDCPELSVSGMLAAVNVMDENSNLFMFTDADAKDLALTDVLIGRATDKTVKISCFIFGSSCFRRRRLMQATRADPVYTRISALTGGQLFNLASTSEAANITALADLLVCNNPVNILSLSITLSAGANASFSIPVDSDMTTVTFSGSGGSIKVLTPSGEAIIAATRDVTYIVQSTGTIISVDTPVVGAWTVQASGSGAFSLEVTGEGGLDLVLFEFVEPAGRPGHEGIS